MTQKIGIDEFGSRLASLCLSGGGRGFPRKPRDQHILLKSVSLVLDPERTYAETELNQALERWLSDVGRAIELDHVTLRRALVDAGYLIRDPAGQSYRADPVGMREMFEPEIESVDPVQLVAEQQAQIELRKKRYLESRE